MPWTTSRCAPRLTFPALIITLEYEKALQGDFEKIRNTHSRLPFVAVACCLLLLLLLLLPPAAKVFLGPELKAVTGDSAGIDEVLQRVEALTVPLKVRVC